MSYDNPNNFSQPMAAAIDIKQSVNRAPFPNSTGPAGAPHNPLFVRVHDLECRLNDMASSCFARIEQLEKEVAYLRSQLGV